MKIRKPYIVLISMSSMLMLFFSLMPFGSMKQASAAELQAYVVKLNADDASVLAPFAQNIERRFTFTDAPEFQHVYRIMSSYSQNQIQQALGSRAAYVQLEQRIVASQVRALDPGFTLNDRDVDKQWGLARTGFPTAWERTTGSFNTIVAVIDTGIDQTHEDLRSASFVAGYNSLKKQGIERGTDSDDNGHGTLITGIIGATANNNKGITGAAWEVSLMPIKALDDEGSGSSTSISEAMVWAAEHGADVINMSLAGMGFAHDEVLASAVSFAFGEDAVLVAAAGNDVVVTGGNLDEEPVFPICDDNGENMIIGVVAVDNNDVKPQFSNFGKACVDVTAPGKRILSTINHDPVSNKYSPNSYAYASGTSLAAPFVAAQAALLRSKFPKATNEQIRDRIISTADPIDNLNLSQCDGRSCKGLLGAGRINVAKSLENDIVTPQVHEGDLVQVEDGTIYFINGGKRQPVSPFVRQQRFPGNVVKQFTFADLGKFPEGTFAEPKDGTLIKVGNDQTVYYMSRGVRLPVTYQVFLMRNFAFKDIVTLSYTEVNSWIAGSFLTPPEGTLVKTGGNPTVYWTVGGVLHPISFRFWQDKGLRLFPIAVFSDQDVKSFPKGESYFE